MTGPTATDPRDPLQNDLQEGFSRAFVNAVVHTAGFFTEDAGRQRDSSGIDLTVLDRHGIHRFAAVQLDLQLKSTAKRLHQDPLRYPLEQRNFDQLRSTHQVPRILVVVMVPRERPGWSESRDGNLLLRHSAWWVSLAGQSANDNERTTTVSIPREQRFDVAALQSIMGRIREGGTP